MSYLLIDAKDPAFDVWIMIVGDVINGENGAVLNGTTTVRPKCRETLNIKRKYSP